MTVDPTTSTALPLPRPPVAQSDAELFYAICDQHGGVDGLTMAEREAALAVGRSYAELRVVTNAVDRSRLIESIVRLEGLLPARAAAAAVSSDGEAFASDVAIAIHVAGELSDDDLLALTEALRTYCPSAGALAALVERNVAVEGQLRDAQLALSQRDFVALNDCLRDVGGDGERVDLVERLRRDLAALGAEVEALRSARVGPVYGRRAPERAVERAGTPGVSPAPAAQNAPRGSSGVPGAIPGAGAPRAPLAPGQFDGLGLATAPAAHTMFDNRNM
jgi:hypothetical protein